MTQKVIQSPFIEQQGWSICEGVLLFFGKNLGGEGGGSSNHQKIVCCLYYPFAKPRRWINSEVLAQWAFGLHSCHGVQFDTIPQMPVSVCGKRGDVQYSDE